MDIIGKILPFLLDGCKYTLLLFIITLAGALPLGMAVMKLRESRFPVIRGIVRGYILIMRGTPLMLQLIFFYFAPYYLMGVSYDRFIAACVALIVNYAAYFAEIFRGGYHSVEKGQFEAARCLGLSPWQTFRFVVLKQMIKPILPTLCNEFMTLVKDTSLVEVIAVAELFGAASKFTASTGSILPIITAGIFYLIMNTVVEQGFALWEKRFAY